MNTSDKGVSVGRDGSDNASGGGCGGASRCCRLYVLKSCHE